MPKSIKLVLLVSFFLVACNKQSSDEISEPAPGAPANENLNDSAGGVDGGGGQAVVCRDSEGKITSAEVLDLFEGKAQYGHTPLEVDTPYKEQVEQIFEKNLVFKEAVVNGSKYYTRNVIEKMRLMPNDVALKIIDDAHEVILPKKCQIEQAVNYINDETILFDSEIWGKLNQTNKAALLLHEGVYRLLRGLDFFTKKPMEKNSIRARHFVSFLISGGIAGKLHHEGWDTSDQSGQCSGGLKEGNSTLFLFSKVNENQIKISFLNLAGKIILAPAIIDDIKVNDSNTVTPVQIFFDYFRRYGPNDRYNINFSGEIKSDFEKGSYVSFYKNEKEFRMTYIDGRTNQQATFNLNCMFH